MIKGNCTVTENIGPSECDSGFNVVAKAVSKMIPELKKCLEARKEAKRQETIRRENARIFRSNPIYIPKRKKK